MTFLTKAICRRAGWDYEQVVVEQTLAEKLGGRRQSRYIIGYGAYFSFKPEDTAIISDVLRDQVERWNELASFSTSLTHSSFEGWSVGHELGDFVYVTHPVSPLSQLVRADTNEPLIEISGYLGSSDQTEALHRFVDTLSCINQPVSAKVSAFQVTYFRA